jgi:hypothetical protein
MFGDGALGEFAIGQPDSDPALAVEACVTVEITAQAWVDVQVFTVVREWAG